MQMVEAGRVVPAPARATLTAPADWLETMARPAARLPAAAGAKRTGTVAEAAGARVSGRAGAVRENSAAWAPERLRAETVSGLPPVLVSVRLDGAETLPRATLPKFREAGVTVRAAGLDVSPDPDSATPRDGAAGSLEARERVAAAEPEAVGAKRTGIVAEAEGAKVMGSAAVNPNWEAWAPERVRAEIVRLAVPELDTARFRVEVCASGTLPKAREAGAADILGVVMGGGPSAGLTMRVTLPFTATDGMVRVPLASAVTAVPAPVTAFLQ